MLAVKVFLWFLYPKNKALKTNKPESFGWDAQAFRLKNETFVFDEYEIQWFVKLFRNYGELLIKFLIINNLKTISVFSEVL